MFTGYALSRTRLRGAKIVMMMYVFSMLFSAGIIPTYMIIVRLYFFGIPDSLEESAKMDGAGNLRILFQIMIPLAITFIATIALFCALFRCVDVH
ncbi:ABC transporter permease subunit [Paenibacillus marchantiophytorum]|uniref:ABC transporter permease subunit n=1 Tax=Paenibacillus marchantiophytorum TaxID=1619310 RepID=UPI001668DB90|nr:ABC transporter permease subunit [Paenibacillus marchantiophytorum]